MSVPRSTQALLALTGTVQPGAVLDIGSDSAVIAQTLHCAYLHDHLSACELARANDVSPVYHADALPAERYRTIFFDARAYEPGYAVELLGQVADRLQPDGVLLTTARRADVEAWFGEVSEHGEALIARVPLSRPAPDPWPCYTFRLGTETVTVQTAPGVFAPRTLDPGTREMLALIRAQPGQRFLDLGCGAGVVSLAAARQWGCQVTAVDVSARALHLTRLNAPEAEVIPSDGFAALAGRQYDMIASNPPYHTDYAVAKRFIEGAYAHLTPGGWLYLVVKRADWYVQKVRSVFGGCRVYEQEGYAILATEKRAMAPRAPKAQEAQPTTKKHAKRMQSAQKRRPHS